MSLTAFGGKDVRASCGPLLCQPLVSCSIWASGEPVLCGPVCPFGGPLVCQGGREMEKNGEHYLQGHPFNLRCPHVAPLLNPRYQPQLFSGA